MILRQMHSYASINQKDKIETPDEDYTPINREVDLVREESRNNEVPNNK